MGSKTLAREDWDRGAEPDNAYYIQNQLRVAGRTVNFQQDPPPDYVNKKALVKSTVLFGCN
ncbi:hypothetical protein QUA54_17735 [Microcoleus sp. MOSTC5]|uniref:hypothetical protein n=1 Tax=Microcoleus sp. MOSTC5 TaxID=3055378 RepID=UPI002FD262FA